MGTKYQSIKKTIIRLLAEFYIPLIASIAWTLYFSYNNPTKREIESIVTIFSTSFFLASWMTGQVVRVRRQAKVEGSLESVANRIENLVQQLDDRTNNINNLMTGGNSIAFVLFTDVGQQNFMPTVVNHGQFGLYNLNARIVNIDNISQNPTFATLNSDIQIHLDEIHAGNAVLKQDSIINLSGITDRNYNIFFHARNGDWVQLMRMRKINEVWLQAFLVVKNGEPVFGRIPVDFPPIGDAQFDNFERNNTPHPI